MVLVKICGITSLADALAAVEAGADALGFNFYRRSPRYVSPADARDIIRQLPSHVMRVGVFVNEPSPAEVAALMDLTGVNVAQLHGDESPEYCLALQGRKVIKALRVGEDFEPATAKGYQVDGVLLDAYVRDVHGGTGRVMNWEVARRVRELAPQLFLAGGLSPENVAEAVNVVRPYAVDACSCLESAPGRKNRERVRAFIAAARAAEL